MVVRIPDVFKNSADIEFANSEVGEHSHSNGLLIAKKMLASMECDSADEFFEIARASLLLRNARFSPGFHDTESEEFQEFYQFVSDAIIYLPL